MEDDPNQFVDINGLGWEDADVAFPNSEVPSSVLSPMELHELQQQLIIQQLIIQQQMKPFLPRENLHDIYRTLTAHDMETATCGICMKSLYNEIFPYPNKRFRPDLNLVATPCYHVFHIACLARNCISNPSNCSCPLCRRIFNWHTNVVNLNPVDIIDIYRSLKSIQQINKGGYYTIKRKRKHLSKRKRKSLRKRKRKTLRKRKTK